MCVCVYVVSLAGHFWGLRTKLVENLDMYEGMGDLVGNVRQTESRHMGDDARQTILRRFLVLAVWDWRLEHSQRSISTVYSSLEHWETEQHKM